MISFLPEKINEVYVSAHSKINSNEFARISLDFDISKYFINSIEIV